MAANAEPGLPSNPPLRLLFRVWGAAAIILSLIYTAILSIPAALSAPFFNGHAVTHIGRLWSWLILRTCGVRVDLEGVENVKGIGPYVVVANHQSYFDIFASAVYLPGEIRFVAKKELLRVPLVGYAMKRSGHIIIDRQSGGNAIRHALRIARQGYNICVFAEGTRSDDNRVHDFSDGAAWLAIATRLPCVPMAISGSAAIFPRKAKIVTPGQRMKMTLGTPIPTRNLKSADRIELTRKLEQAVRSMFTASD